MGDAMSAKWSVPVIVENKPGAGTIVGSAKPVHLGKTTQVWDAIVTHRDSGKTIALFRCTQMILWPRQT